MYYEVIRWRSKEQVDFKGGWGIKMGIFLHITKFQFLFIRCTPVVDIMLTWLLALGTIRYDKFELHIYQMYSPICLLIVLYRTFCRKPYFLRYRQLEVGGVTMYGKG